MTHIAIQEHLNEKTVEWMEKVSDTQYGTQSILEGQDHTRAGPTRLRRSPWPRKYFRRSDAHLSGPIGGMETLLCAFRIGPRSRHPQSDMRDYDLLAYASAEDTSWARSPR
jgi:hypothetical protein